MPKKYKDIYSITKDIIETKNQHEEEVRPDKVNLARERVKSGYYNDKNVMKQFIDKLFKDIGLE